MVIELLTNIGMILAVVMAGMILYRVISGWVVRKQLRAASDLPVTGRQERIVPCQED